MSFMARAVRPLGARIFPGPNDSNFLGVRGAPGDSHLKVGPENAEARPNFSA
jgi:hypothetical protein